MAETIKNKILRTIARVLKADLPIEYTNPVDQIVSLPDDPRTFYMILFKDEVPQRLVEDTADNLLSAFIKKYKRDPRGIYYATKDIEEIKKLSRDEVKSLIVPWLEENKR